MRTLNRTRSARMQGENKRAVSACTRPSSLFCTSFVHNMSEVALERRRRSGPGSTKPRCSSDSQSGQGRAGDGIVQESTPGQFSRSGRDMNARLPPAETGRKIYSSARSRSAATARRTVSCQSMPSFTRCRLLTVGSASEGRTAGSALRQRAVDVQAGATHRRRRGRP
jgi:hypothetical protein